MDLDLQSPFAANSAVNPEDVCGMKRVLNRLGYYLPQQKLGMTDIPDRSVFNELKSFQKDHDLSTDGKAKPGDETVQALNEAQTQETAGGSYKWCTVGDDKVRPAHAEREGQTFSWDSPPDGEHPGEDYNCRCWAEDVSDNTQKPEEPQKAEGLEQVVTSEIKDAAKKWGDKDFVYHFYFGGGDDVTLSQIGLLGAVIDHAREIMFDRVENQISGDAKQVESGQFKGSWDNSYDFGDVVFSLGNSVVSGTYSGTVQKNGNILVITAKVQYHFSDTFTDPASIRQKITGSSSLDRLPKNIATDLFAGVTEAGGTPYNITGEWTTKLTGSIPLKEE